MSAVAASSAAPGSKPEERPPGGGKCEEVEEKPSPPRIAPTLLDYASQSFLSAARSKALGANDCNSDVGMPSPSMPQLKPEKPVAPSESNRPRRVLTPEAFLDHFKAITQQQLINKAKLLKPGSAMNIPPPGGAAVDIPKMAPPSVSVHAVEYTADQTDKRHINPVAPSGGVNSTSAKTSPASLTRVMSPTSVLPLRNVTAPRQMAPPSDHLSQKDLSRADHRLSSAELTDLLLMAGNKPKPVAPSPLSPKDVGHVSDRMNSAEIANLIKNAASKLQTSAAMSQCRPTDGSTVPTSQVKPTKMPGGWLQQQQQQQQQGYLSGERAVTGQSKGVQGADLKHRSPPGQRSPVSARPTEQLASVLADTAKEQCAKFASGPLRWSSDSVQLHDGHGVVLTSGEKKRQPVSAPKLQRQGSVGNDQVLHGMVAPPGGIVRQTTVPMQRSHSQELCSMMAPSGGTERQSPGVSGGQQKRRSSVSYGQEVRRTTPPGGMERQSPVSPATPSQSGAGANREHRISLDRRRLSMTPPTSAASQRSPAMFTSPSSPRQQHGLSHIGGATSRQPQQPSYGGMSLTEAHQQVLAANQNSYVKQALSMAPPDSRPNQSLISSTCSSPLYWSTPLSHPAVGSPRTSLPMPLFTPSGLAGDRGASIIATTAAMFSLPADMPPRSSVGYLGLNQLSLPKTSPPHLSHPSQQHHPMHLNGSPEQVTGLWIYLF